MLALSISLLVLSALVAAANIYGASSAMIRLQRGESRGYSSVPLVSLLFAVASWATGHQTLGLWVFLPTALDPGTWMMLYLPVVLFREWRDDERI